MMSKDESRGSLNERLKVKQRDTKIDRIETRSRPFDEDLEKLASCKFATILDLQQAAASTKACRDPKDPESAPLAVSGLASQSRLPRCG